MSTTHETSGRFDALAAVSPMQLGDEDKNQDRAGWLETEGVATVCDGVSASPHAGRAAEIAMNLSPVLFGEQGDHALETLARLLMARRQKVQQAEVILPAGTAAAMRPHLIEAVRERRTQAYQTTLAAIQLVLSDGKLLVEQLWCGDSAIFAFSPDGELLATSLVCHDHAEDGNGKIRFGPCDELLVKIVATASEKPELTERAGIQPAHAHNWYVCQVLDQSGLSGHTNNRGVRLLNRDALVLAPRFLVGETRETQPYVRLRYSSVVRFASSPPQTTFERKGTVTAVLPDHFECGAWTRQRDAFPLDTHIVLASDGFYDSFESPSDLHQWLVTNDAALREPEKQARLIKALHARLHAKRGDDDMSFVWVRAQDEEGNCAADSDHYGIAEEQGNAE